MLSQVTTKLLLFFDIGKLFSTHKSQCYNCQIIWDIIPWICPSCVIDIVCISSTTCMLLKSGCIIFLWLCKSKTCLNSGFFFCKVAIRMVWRICNQFVLLYLKTQLSTFLKMTIKFLEQYFLMYRINSKTFW